MHSGATDSKKGEIQVKMGFLGPVRNFQQALNYRPTYLYVNTYTFHNFIFLYAFKYNFIYLN